jgi:hypothetical protein
MAYILASITDDFRKYMPQFLGRMLGISGGTSLPGAWNPLIKGFKVGEGGWIDPGTGAVPRVVSGSNRFAAPPTANGLQDLDCIVDQGRSVMTQRYITGNPTDRISTFYKPLINADFTWDPLQPTTMRIKCLLDFAEFNLNTSTPPVAPHIWELGIFAEHPLYPPSVPPPVPPLYPGQTQDQLLMIAYGTFPLEVKDASKQIEHYVLLVD